MDKAHIIQEIQRTAKDGVPLGWRRFEEVTGIRYYDWYGQFWTRWGDAVREAGCEPNRMSEAYSEETLTKHLVLLTRRLGHIPTQGDLLLAAKNEPEFPSEKAFRRLGQKSEKASKVLTYCRLNPGHEDVATLWGEIKLTAKQADITADASQSSEVGYVYLLMHGSRREYKIGKTYNPIRREGEIRLQLPEKITPIHYIETDDPTGVESYWHTRFASKRKEGEWFILTPRDIAAFKRWRKIY